MGWIHERFKQKGYAKWGRPVSPEKLRAPLKKIVRTVRYAGSLFDTSSVELECGHVVEARGQIRARCVKCGAARD
jgi:hypothetical protein